MAYSKKRLLLSILFGLLISPIAFCGDLEFEDAKVDPKKNVVFTYVLENLPLNADEVLSASLNYLQTEYKTTKYKDIEYVVDKGIAYGKGSLDSFFTGNGLISSEIFSADYYLRLDAKDGKARIQLIFNKYNVQKLSDTSNRKTTEVIISEKAPFVDADGNGRYKKAFKSLTENANIVLNSVVDKLKSVTPAPTLDEW